MINRLRSKHEQNRQEMRNGNEAEEEAEQKKATGEKGPVGQLKRERDMAKQRHQVLNADVVEPTKKEEDCVRAVNDGMSLHYEAETENVCLWDTTTKTRNE